MESDAREQRQDNHAVHRRRVSGEHPGRQGGLRLRRASRGRHDPPRLPQHGPVDRAAVRRPARGRSTPDPHHPDRHRLKWRNPQVLPLPTDGRGLRRRPRGDRGVGQAQLRLARTQPGLQGGVPGHARRQRRLLRPLPGERQTLVPRGPGAGPVLEPRDHPPARRPQPPGARGRGRVHARRGGARRRARGERRQGRRDGFSTHPFQLHRPPRPGAGAEEGVRRSSAPCRWTRPG